MKSFDKEKKSKNTKNPVKGSQPEKSGIRGGKKDIKWKGQRTSKSYTEEDRRRHPEFKKSGRDDTAENDMDNTQGDYRKSSKKIFEKQSKGRGKDQSRYGEYRKEEGRRDKKTFIQSGAKGHPVEHGKNDGPGDEKYIDKGEGNYKRRNEKERETKFQNKGYSKKKVLEHKKKQETDGKVRLNKYIANSGICSRREADVHISAGLVSINGKIITELGYQVSPGDVVKYNGVAIRREKNVYVLLNKPKDYITTMEDPGGRKTVMELIENACRERIYPVGRLDRNTTGLLLFTNDGDLAKKLTHPKHGIKKIYHVETDSPVKKSDMEKMLKGVELEDFFVKADEVSYVGEAKKEVGVMLHSGQNRVVRRMFEHFGYKVVKLDRVYFAGLTKKNLPRGKFRMLTDKEVSMLKMIG